jgi:glycosyltransferase involved in cell wall biosynthesis
MNILILSLYSPTGTNFQEGIGGSQEVIYQLGKRWVEEGHNVKIISAYRDKNIPKKEILDGLEIERVASFYAAVPSIKRTYKKNEKWADIVLENYTSYPLYTPLYVKKPLIIIMHHLMGLKYVNTVGLTKGTIGYFSEKSIPLFYKNSKFIAVSEFAKNQLLSLKIPGANIKTIPNGINTSYFIPFEKESTPLVLFIGNFRDGRKKIDDLLEAFKKVSDEIPEAKLIIAGPGGDKVKMVKSLARSSKKIEYLGMVNSETKKGLYQKSWVFVNPSIAEGFSLSCLEANACGTPAIVYQLKGLETIQQEINGLVVEKNNVNKLANAVILLLTNHGLREEMSNNARKFAERFNWDIAAEMYLTTLENF